MAKKIVAEIRLQLPAGAATPAPPVGPALGSKGVNTRTFCDEFNKQTKHMAGLVVPVVISVYADRSFSFILKSPPAAILLMKAAGQAKGSAIPNRNKVGEVTRAQLLEIVRMKLQDLNCQSEESGLRMIMGTARSMGINCID